MLSTTYEEFESNLVPDGVIPGRSQPGAGSLPTCAAPRAAPHHTNQLLPHPDHAGQRYSFACPDHAGQRYSIAHAGRLTTADSQPGTYQAAFSDATPLSNGYPFANGYPGSAQMAPGLAR